MSTKSASDVLFVHILGTGKVLVKWSSGVSAIQRFLMSIKKKSRLSELSIISWVSIVNPLILKIKFSCYNISYQMHIIL